MQEIFNFINSNSELSVILGFILFGFALKLAKKAIKIAITLGILAFLLITLGII